MSADRKELSDKRATFLKKRLYGPLLVILAIALMYLMYKGYKWTWFLFIICAGIGFYYLRLARTYFDQNSIWINNKQFSHEQIQKVSAFEIEHVTYLTLKINQNGKSKWYWTDPGNKGILAILIDILLRKKHPFQNLKEFLDLMRSKGILKD